MDEPRPTLIVVTGRPGAGKTTLSWELARKVRCPLISRDELKEGYVHTSGMPNDTEMRMLYELFFETIELLLTHKITLIAEAAFQHKLWVPKLENLQKMANVKLIICSPSLEIVQERVSIREIQDPERLRFHETPIPGDYQAPEISVPTLFVDTSEGYQPDIAEIVRFVSHA